MTPRDLAKKAQMDLMGVGGSDAVDILEAAFSSAIASERERCALIVESDEAGHFSTDRLVRKALAKKIREGK